MAAITFVTQLQNLTDLKALYATAILSGLKNKEDLITISSTMNIIKNKEINFDIKIRWRNTKCVRYYLEVSNKRKGV